MQNILTLPLSEGGNTIIFGSSGSGKELLLSSILYSAITNYNPNQINFYIMDFGAETLKMFEQAPQVGGVLSVDDTERIENLFKMISQVMEERKTLFSDYNGSYNFYIEHSNKTIPMMVIIINNYEAFSETYEEYEDLMIQLSREGQKYGVIFILTTNSTNAVRYRLRQNFKQNISLQFNDSSDYSDVLPNVGKKYPSKIFGRGLVEIDDVYEFQTAYPYKQEKLSEYIKIISTRLRSICSETAMTIPVLPDVVSVEFVEEKAGSLTHIPIGVVKNDLTIATFDFRSNPVTLVTALDFEENNHFFKALIKLFNKVPNQKLVVIDAMKMFNEKEATDNYINTNFDKIIDIIGKKYDEQTKLYESNDFNDTALQNFAKTTYLICGVSNLMSRISEDKKDILSKALKSSKEYNVDSYILVDTADKLKGFAYEDWYKNAVDDSQGIWIGNGISDQYAIKLMSTPRELREEIPEGFGYVVKNGKAALVKLIAD